MMNETLKKIESETKRKLELKEKELDDEMGGLKYRLRE